jgi:hypothetical protein
MFAVVVVILAVAGVAVGPWRTTPHGSVNVDVIVVDPALSCRVFPDPHEFSADCSDD